MSISDGPICSTNNINGESTSSSFYWLLASKGDTLRIITPRTPASATATGLVGEICWDANFIYVCIANNTWHRAAHATW